MIVSTNQDVQTALNQLGYHGANGAALTVDGIVGANTTFAVKAFQTDHSLSVDGIAGPITKAALTAALAAAGDPVAVSATVQDSSQGPTVAVHVAPTPTTPAMTVHTTTAPSGSVTTAVRPYGTPASASSALALLTGAKPNTPAPAALHAASMSTTTKVGIGVAVAGAIALAWAKAKGKL